MPCRIQRKRTRGWRMPAGGDSVLKLTATEDDHQVTLLDTIHLLGTRNRVRAFWIPNEMPPPAGVKRGTPAYYGWLGKLRRKGYEPGACDLLVYWPWAPPSITAHAADTPFKALFIEVKRPGGRLSKSQKLHHAELKRDGIAHMVWDDGDPETAINWLRAHGCPL